MIINTVNKSTPTGLFHGGFSCGTWRGYGDNGQIVVIADLRDYKSFKDKKTMLASEIIELSNIHRIEYQPFGSLHC